MRLQLIQLDVNQLPLARLQHASQLFYKRAHKPTKMRLTVDSFLSLYCAMRQWEHGTVCRGSSWNAAIEQS
eukprot:6452-Heterococcus_DN1.PRE.2